jgi:DNA invertase Pin-like site-specific DNA recombinase
MPTHSSSPLAYSYIRFSTPEQMQGDSLRRQTEAAADWCQRHKVTLDTRTTLRDLGKSAYTGAHRQNPDRHALAAFLKLVESGKVLRGSYLVLENLDRLSREHIQPALLLALNLLQAGVRIVQLKPAEMVFDDKSDTLPVMMMMMELSRGHGESAMKSERVGAAWEAKRKRARENGEILTRNLPAWIEEKDGKFELIPERAAVVKRIFALAAAGYGNKLIVRRFIAEGVPPFGKFKINPGRSRSQFAGKWVRSYLQTILADRRAVGEFQPRGKNGKPDGDPIPNYFPAVVTEEEFHASRAGAAIRRLRPGRVSHYINLFSGLLLHARDGGTYYCRTLGKKDKNRRVLINAWAQEARAKCYSFDYEVFEAAILSCLREIDPHEILNGDTGPDETIVLAGELARIEAKIGELEGELLKGDVATVAKVLRQLEGQKADLAARLAMARQKAAHPLSESWGEAQSLVDALAAATDPVEARLRLRAALRRMIEGIWLLVVPRNGVRLAAVQIWFTGGKRHRDYLLYYLPSRGNKYSHKQGGWYPWNLADVVKLGPLDLRQKKTARLEALLTVLPLDALLEGVELIPLANGG